jgi:mannose/fructose/N-acetylgalactosamine-specific phosphotransferase system component IID
LKAYSILLTAVTAIVLLMSVYLGFQEPDDMDQLNQDLHRLRTLAAILGLLSVGAVMVELFRGDRDRW